MKIVKLLPFPKIFGRLHHFDQIQKKTCNRGIHIVPV